MALSHSPKIVTDGLILCLDAANPKSYPGTGTTVTDVSNNQNNGVLVNSPIHSSDGYFEFDGVDSYISRANLGLSDHSIQCWVNMRQSVGASTGDTLVSIIGNYSRVSSGKYMYIGPYNTNQFTYRIDDGAISHRLVASASYVTNQWYHVAMTYNSSGMTRAYLNGQDIGGYVATANIVFDNTRFDIGRSENGKILDGLISNVMVHDRELSGAEVKQNFQALRGRYSL